MYCDRVRCGNVVCYVNYTDHAHVKVQTSNKNTVCTGSSRLYTSGALTLFKLSVSIIYHHLGFYTKSTFFISILFCLMNWLCLFVSGWPLSFGVCTLMRHLVSSRVYKIPATHAFIGLVSIFGSFQNRWQMIKQYLQKICCTTH